MTQDAQRYADLVRFIGRAEWTFAHLEKVLAGYRPTSALAQHEHTWARRVVQERLDELRRLFPAPGGGQ